MYLISTTTYVFSVGVHNAWFCHRAIPLLHPDSSARDSVLVPAALATIPIPPPARPLPAPAAPALNPTQVDEIPATISPRLPSSSRTPLLGKRPPSPSPSPSPRRGDAIPHHGAPPRQPRIAAPPPSSRVPRSPSRSPAPCPRRPARSPPCRDLPSPPLLAAVSSPRQAPALALPPARRRNPTSRRSPSAISHRGAPSILACAPLSFTKPRYLQSPSISDTILAGKSRLAMQSPMDPVGPVAVPVIPHGSDRTSATCRACPPAAETPPGRDSQLPSSSSTSRCIRERCERLKGTCKRHLFLTS
jgi:hypothetical protein